MRSAKRILILGGHRDVAAPITYDTDAQAFFDAMSTPPDATRKGHYNTAIVALKTAEVWAKRDAIYFFAAADSQAALLNAKAPEGSFNATAEGAPTFTADQGFTGASGKYINTNYNPTTSGGQYAQDSACISGWAVTADSSPLWGTVQATTKHECYPRFSDGNMYGAMNSGSEGSAAVATAVGLTSLTRVASGSFDSYKNGVLLANHAIVSAEVLLSNFTFLLGIGESYLGIVGYGAFGSGLTGPELLAEYNAVHPYMQAVAGVA